MKIELFATGAVFWVILGGTAASAAPLQQAVAVGPCQEYLGNGKWRPCSSSSNSNSQPDDTAARNAIAERKLGESAAALGDAAFARGDFKAAAIAYLTAMRHQPGNIEYKKQRARALEGYRKQLGVGLVSDADEVDTPPPTTHHALVEVEAPTFSDTLFSALEIPIDLKDPANAAIKKLAAQMERTLDSNLDILRRDDGTKPDAKGLADTVDAMNELLKGKLPPGTEPLTVDKVEAVHTSYRIKDPQ